jgi:hypothetical protein
VWSLHPISNRGDVIKRPITMLNLRLWNNFLRLFPPDNIRMCRSLRRRTSERERVENIMIEGMEEKATQLAIGVSFFVRAWLPTAFWHLPGHDELDKFFRKGHPSAYSSFLPLMMKRPSSSTLEKERGSQFSVSCVFGRTCQQPISWLWISLCLWERVWGNFSWVNMLFLGKSWKF